MATYPPQTWPEGATPTVDQLRTWLRAHDPAEHDARVAADMILGMLAEQARAVDSQRRVAQAALDLAGRYRLAWLSARARRRTRGVI